MPSWMHARVIVLGALFLLAVCLPSSAQKPKLSQVQVLQLIQIQQPDDVTASLIRSRGLSFTVTPKVVQSMAAKGAKPLTLAALREKLILGKGSVAIESTPGAQFFLDGRAVGVIGTDGTYLLNDVTEGDHQLTVRMSGYRDADSKFTLQSNETKKIPLPMDWMGGYLTVSVQPSGAWIKVSGPATFEDSATDKMIPLGNYTVTVSAGGYVTQTRSFLLGIGEHHVESFQLVFDLASALDKANRGDQSSLHILELAVERGDSVTCKIKTGGFDFTIGPYVIDGTVTVNKDAVTYHRTYGGDRYEPDFTISPKGLSLLAYEQTVPLSIHVKVPYMNKKGTKEHNHDYHFYNAGATVVDTVGRPDQAKYTFTKGIACDGCDNSLNVLYDLLQKVNGAN